MAFAYRDGATSPSGQAFLIEALPVGGLKEVTPTSGPLTWLSEVPGNLGITGLIVHKLFFRGRWRVLVREIVRGSIGRTHADVRAADMESANEIAASIAEQIRAGTFGA
ncbi:MAG: hypothetical protein U0R80_00175 [Nocardioidaceae bacterium]